MPSSCAILTRKKAKRERSLLPIVPSRQVMRRKAFVGSAATRSATGSPLRMRSWLSRRPSVAQHTDGVVEAEHAHGLAKLAAVAVRAVGENDVAGHAIFDGTLHHLDGQVVLGLEDIVSGILLSRRRRSPVQVSGKYSAKSMGTCAERVATLRLTATWQLVILPAVPVY